MSQQDITQPIVFLGCYLKRCTASLGLNTTPTTVDLEIVPGYGNLSYDISQAATGFQRENAIPGKMARITIGQFDFAGIIQSWYENWSTAGLTYSIRMADPRIILDGVPVVVGFGNTEIGTNFTNVLDAASYYGNPLSLGSNDNGTQWSKIKEYLTSSGINVNIFGKLLTISFSSGFSEATGLSTEGIPPWYRIKSNTTSFNQLIQQVATDFNFDFYGYIDTSGFSSSTGVINSFKIEYIDRNSATGTINLDSLISQTRTSGTLISYKRGQELRSDANQSVISGPAATYWVGANSAGGSPSLFSYWGDSDDGSPIYDENETWGDGVTASGIGAIPVTTRRHFGAVLLNNIVGSGVDSIFAGSQFRIPFTKYSLTQTYSPNNYPPLLIASHFSTETTGYIAHETVLRAALFNQESWEVMLYKYHPTIASAIGITSQTFREASEFNSNITSLGDIYRSLSLKKIDLQSKGSRSAYTEALIGAVYDATRKSAEDNYGKKYIVKINGYSSLFNSNWLDAGYLFGGNSSPEIEYRVVDNAWSQDAGAPMPSGVTNHPVLNDINNATFKDNVGRLRSFVSYTDFSSTGNSEFPYKIDTSILSEGDYIIEQGDKLCVPISVRQYDKFPTLAIIEIGQDIRGINDASGFVDRGAYRDFLYDLGYTDQMISQYGLLENIDDSATYGLAQARPCIIKSAPGNYGVHFPVEFKTKVFGPWSSTSNSFGAINLTQDSDLGPWSFGSYQNLEEAANQTVAKLTSNLSIIDSAELTLAGLPMFNLGANVGDNSNITSISFQVGQEGLVTNYSLKTFAIPPGKPSKLLTDKISEVYNETHKNKKDIVNLNKFIGKERNTTITKVSEIQKAFDASINLSESQNPLISIVEPRNV